MSFSETLMASVTVWYDPEPSFVDNIESYASYTDMVIVVDNSTHSNEALFDKIKKQSKIYIGNGQNVGIAAAFNQGITIALQRGYQFMLTMDQDSFFEMEELQKFIKLARDADWTNVGILSPIHLQQKSIPAYNATSYTPALCVMASGNILNLNLVQQAGFFKDDLFIDHVDNEFCLRLASKGYTVLIANAFLIHKLGNYIDARLFGVRVGGFISHSPERLYYFVRNAIYIIKKYRHVDSANTKMEITSLIKRFFKIAFEDQKLKRLNLYLKGILDHRKL